MTRLVDVDPLDPDPRILEDAARVLRAGGLVAIPTETVYGLAAIATSSSATARIFEAKGRPAGNPLIVHASDLDHARRYAATWPITADRLARRWWPGPLTLVIPKRDEIPDVVTAGRGSVALRVPAAAIARRLIEVCGSPIAAPSANRSMGVSPTDARHVLEDLDGRVDLILDAGPCIIGLESTVIDLTTDPPRLLRPGAITLAQLEATLGRRVADATVKSEPDEGKSLASPGRMSVHYAPRTPTWRAEAGDSCLIDESPARWGMLVLGPLESFVARASAAPCEEIRLGSPDLAARELYRSLRDLDARGLDDLLIIAPPRTPEWAAVRDRIERASRPLSERRPRRPVSPLEA
ncbi:MAG: L-threonylcarbamoyladenylate synthase [Isosphaeraceae bacterium]|nr:L-threonylcarbamoyladenylate synthase [Isosphaeraceae bacterium]